MSTLNQTNRIVRLVIVAALLVLIALVTLNLWSTQATTTTTTVEDEAFIARQLQNEGAARDQSVVVRNWAGHPDPGLHMFEEGGGYAVYAGLQAGQGNKIAHISQQDASSCRIKSDATEICMTYNHADTGLQTVLYSNGTGGLVAKVRPKPAEGPETVSAEIMFEAHANGLITIKGTGQGGAAFLLTPGDNPQTIVIIADDGTWQTDVAFVRGSHTIKLQDMDEAGNATGLAAMVVVDIQ